MNYYKPKNLECEHNNDCRKCNLFSSCFPKTYELRQAAITKRWKKKYGDEF